MRPIRTLPFLRAQDNVPTVAWLDSGGGALPESRTGWDQDAKLHVTSAVKAPWGKMFSEMQLGSDSIAVLSLIADCAQTQIRIVLGHTNISRASSDKVLLNGELHGTQVRDRVELILSLVLISCGSDAGPVAASMPGSVLWQVSTTLHLGLNLGGFPVTWVDFRKTLHLPERAAWYLDWDAEELDRDLNDGARLLLNSAHKQLVDSLRGPATPVGRGVLEFLYYELARTLIRGALQNEEFVTGQCYREGSLGHRISALISQVFPDIELSGLAERMSMRPGRFDRELQHGVSFLAALE